MLHQLASHNVDIKQLIDKGYAVGIDSNYLVIRDIPYLNDKLELQWGSIVSKLVFMDKDSVKQQDHQVFFCGSHPFNIEGAQIPNMGGGSHNLPLKGDDLKVERSFSNKPVGSNGFANHFLKIESYVTIISGPAIHKYEVSPYTFRMVDDPSTSVFKIRDTLTSRAEITDLAEKFKDDVIAIIGLGGTGSYILDLISKVGVAEIKGFDSDEYYIHNVFRSPGQFRTADLNKKKAEVYQHRYENLRNGITLKDIRIDSESKDEMKDVTFAFVCVDNGDSRSEIFKLLLELKIPFIDVGMGLHRAKGPIDGLVRTSYYSAENASDLVKKSIAPMADHPDDVYRTMIQIAELNALNASLAVIKYKQTKGFYVEEESNNHLLFCINDCTIVRENL